MNKDRPSRKPRRSYDNSLRLEHANRTRERILESAVQVLTDGDGKVSSLAEVARAAGVSEPTLYRHFGTRERLLEELEAHWQTKLGFPGLPTKVDDLPAHVGRLFDTFEEHAPLLRSSIRNGVGWEMRLRGRAKRINRIRELVVEKHPDLDDREIDRLTGVLRVLASWEAFDTLTQLGLSSRDAGEAVTWAMKILMANAPTGAGKKSVRAGSPTKSSGKRPAKEKEA
jgi:AcrR family transcriptional regulator